MLGRLARDAAVAQLFRWRPVRWFFGIVGAILVLTLVAGVVGAIAHSV